MTAPSAPQNALPPQAEAVLEVVDAIPPGRVLSYGDIAQIVGGMGPRTVGRVLSHYGALTHWWRVVRSDGRPATGHEARALVLLAQEGVPLRSERIQMANARWEGPGVGGG